MVGKAHKSHWARSGLYGGCSDGVSTIHFFQAEQRIQFTSAKAPYSLCMRRDLNGILCSAWKNGSVEPH
jgi:hypothetical protein